MAPDGLSLPSPPRRSGAPDLKQTRLGRRFPIAKPAPRKRHRGKADAVRFIGALFPAGRYRRPGPPPKLGPLDPLGPLGPLGPEPRPTLAGPADPGPGPRLMDPPNWPLGPADGPLNWRL